LSGGLVPSSVLGELPVTVLDRVTGPTVSGGLLPVGIPGPVTEVGGAQWAKSLF